MMPFALVPDEGRPPRITRFVSERIAEVILNGALAVLDHEQNVLYIDRAKWLTLNKTEQHILERTHEPITMPRQAAA